MTLIATFNGMVLTPDGALLFDPHHRYRQQVKSTFATAENLAQSIDAYPGIERQEAVVLVMTPWDKVGVYDEFLPYPGGDELIKIDKDHYEVIEHNHDVRVPVLNTEWQVWTYYADPDDLFADFDD